MGPGTLQLWVVEGPKGIGVFLADVRLGGEDAIGNTRPLAHFVVDSERVLDLLLESQREMIAFDMPDLEPGPPNFPPALTQAIQKVVDIRQRMIQPFELVTLQRVVKKLGDEAASYTWIDWALLVRAVCRYLATSPEPRVNDSGWRPVVDDR
jgi:hypothetical protein